MKTNQEQQLIWNGIPVLTTRMLAERLGVMEINIRKNFMINKSRFIENQDYFIIKGNDLKALRKELRNSGLLSYLPGKQASFIAIWTEGGAHNHAKISNTDESWEAFLWLKNNYFIQREALKAIKDSYEAKNNPLFPHTTRPVQIENSKAANKKNFEEGGVKLTVEYNYRSCLLLSGKTPKQLKDWGKKQGLKSKQCQSAKEVCRNLFPVVAAKMSISDDFYTHGVSLEESTNLSNHVSPVLEKMYELGMLNKKAS